MRLERGNDDFAFEIVTTQVSMQEVITDVRTSFQLMSLWNTWNFISVFSNRIPDGFSSKGSDQVDGNSDFEENILQEIYRNVLPIFYHNMALSKVFLSSGRLEMNL